MKNENKKILTYLAGPMDDVSIGESRNWREMLTKKLPEFGIGVLNPIAKYGADYGNIRKKFASWQKYGNVNAIRDKVSKEIIPPDMKMVEDCNFITLYIPAEEGEICGSYGEMSIGFYLGRYHRCPRCDYTYPPKPIYIVTRRRLRPLNLPKWAIGCSTCIFKNWDEYLDFIKKNWAVII